MCHRCNGFTGRKDILEYYRSFITDGYITIKDFIKLKNYTDEYPFIIQNVIEMDFYTVFSTDIQPEELFPDLTKERLEKLLVLL